MSLESIWTRALADAGNSEYNRAWWKIDIIAGIFNSTRMIYFVIFCFQRSN
ncbi:hypothetical protein RchiOBHm_Chr5g0035531 [Rosa chinensis]|uniref:Uncharacterized protein n=1 Tax=Rosa chinensis TaxID=74649 RepID=A0A2P6QB81_ROSCH|nr:hypothetical protein RchiOBHm_Chr5g0035531 [Rosa chinensis]